MARLAHNTPRSLRGLFLKQEVEEGEKAGVSPGSPDPSACQDAGAAEAWDQAGAVLPALWAPVPGMLPAAVGPWRKFPQTESFPLLTPCPLAGPLASLFFS